jgi:mannose-6-phosphate isomerase
MSARSLRAIPVERVWGRHDLPAGFPRAVGDPPTGEIWFEASPDAALLVKYLFTSERLSIQVHPGDDAARARGLPRGKDEAWFVIDAEPGAMIGLGLIHKLSREALREAALDGSIESLLDWHEVKKGDVFYSPAGTIHAIGGGIALIEVQQNLDVTYRLYDYGRPRELHLDEALDVAVRERWSPAKAWTDAAGRHILAEGGAFTLERWASGGEIGDGAVIIPLSPGGAIDGEALDTGTVWAVEGEAKISGPQIDVLIARPA